MERARFPRYCARLREKHRHSIVAEAEGDLAISEPRTVSDARIVARIPHRCGETTTGKGRRILAGLASASRGSNSGLGQRTSAMLMPRLGRHEPSCVERRQKNC